MLTPAQVWEINRLLRRGFSGRSVAKLMGIGRGSVANVAHDRHCPGHSRQTEVGTQDGFQGPAGPVRRCAKAGHLFYGPVCLTCFVRALRGSEPGRAARRKYGPGEGSRFIGIELTGGPRARWLELQALKRSQGEALNEPEESPL